MKNISLSLLCVFFAVHFSFGQQWSLGVQSGINLSKIATPVFEDPFYKMGLQSGLRLEYSPNSDNRLFFALTPNYSVKGNRTSIVIQNGAGNITAEKRVNVLTLNYLEIPVLIGYKFKAGKIFQYYPLLGLSIGYLLSAKYAAVDEQASNPALGIINVSYINVFQVRDVGFEISRFELAYIAGLGGQFALSPKLSLNIEAIYNSSLNNLIQIHTSKIASKNQLYSTRLGLVYKLE